MGSGTEENFKQNLTISNSSENETEIYKELSQDQSIQLEDYTAVLWQKPTWTVPCGLCGCLLPSENDSHVKRYYEALQHTLSETGLPETIDMTREAKKVTRDQVTIGILSSPVECMSILLSGGEQCPGDMLLILSHSWCRKLPSPSLANKYSLYVHQAVTFHKGGYSFLERYSPPRRVTYFVNFFTNACTGGVCYEESKYLVRNEINKFITQIKDASFNKLVVKPSGVLWYGSKFVSFHDKMDIEGITSAVENVIRHLEERDSVLVEEYIQFEQPQLQQQDDSMDTVRIRSTVCRTSSEKPQTTKITCGIGSSDQPVNGDNSVPHSLELSLKKFGFSDVQIKEIRKDIELQSEKTMASIIKNEKNFSEEKRGEVGAQTDVIGIDLILKKQAEKYEVVVIEVNSHDCMINCQVYEFMNPNTLHEAATELVQTMIARSNAFLMNDKTLLIIGAGSYSKWFIFEEAIKLGIKVVLVDTDLDDSMPKVSEIDRGVCLRQRAYESTRLRRDSGSDAKHFG
ncbi:CRNS1 [Acanthosepion pharaonis]|uniref:CRNS1 n=1 Tax=Acanthosepion pharaonis TaxID=158019 RepID=A0A812BXB1_ACAPH|nr:CRNS1 [Sepia pharaonis]